MNTLFKYSRTTSSLLVGFRNLLITNTNNLCLNSSSKLLTKDCAVIKPSILFESAKSTTYLISNRTNYTFNLNSKLVRYRRATRPKKTNDNSVMLNYEQSQFAENIGVTKSWNSWNTSNLLDGKRQAESASDDILIRKFLYGTFHDLFASEILIKRRFNTINIGFLVKLPKVYFSQKVYFLVGYSEELLSSLLKCTVKIQVQTIYNKNDLVFRNW